MTKRMYIIVFSYNGKFEETYHSGVVAKCYGDVEKNIKDIFINGVEMTPQEAARIIKNEWYYIITLEDEEWYRVKVSEGGVICFNMS